MKYCRHIQNTLDSIERQLKQEIDIEDLADKACMSKATFYRVFYYLVGDAIYSYIRKRRLSEAAIELIDSDKKVIDVALDYGYDSPEAFSRAFKACFEKPPSSFRKNWKGTKLHRRIVIMNDKQLSTDEYPEVKVVEELAPMTVASCHITGNDPEISAITKMIEWAREKGVPWEIGKARHFGFNNPDLSDPENNNKPHGYETWMTVPSGTSTEGEIKLKIFPGGTYVTTKTTVAEVTQAWKRLVDWCDAGKHELGDHQWLEEVLAFDFEDEMNIRLKIMLPIKVTV